MVVDNEVAKERIWKEHCQKLTNQNIRNGDKTGEFTLNPYRLQRNKPVSDPINPRPVRFLDRNQNALEACAVVLARSGTGTSSEAALSQLSAAKANKERAQHGSNIFNAEKTMSHGARSAKQEEWNSLNRELGGGDKAVAVALTKTTLPTISKKSAKKNSAKTEEATSPVATPEEKTDRDATIQQMLVRASKVPTDKYSQPVLESHTLGWEVKNAKRPMSQFTFGLVTCDITRFQEHAALSPQRGGKKD